MVGIGLLGSGFIADTYADALGDTGTRGSGRQLLP